ncbi:MAG: macro domain-containing protein [Bacillota bacterium]
MIVHCEISDVTVECVQGDITDQAGFDAVVNAANAQLRPGGGVAGAIHAAAGPSLYEECRPLAPIGTGEAAITGGGNLPNPFVIHALGPVYASESQPARQLARAYRNSLLLAEEHHLESVAFPALSTGAFGYPLEEAARVAMTTVAEMAEELSHVRRIRFVLHDREALRVHEMALKDILGNS